MSHQLTPYYVLITRALEKIEEYLPGTLDDFLTSSMAQDAIHMRLQEIGEILSKMRRIEPELFARPEHDAWNKLIALRNVISHGYDSVEPRRIWQILIDELPAFGQAIERASHEIE